MDIKLIHNGVYRYFGNELTGSTRMRLSRIAGRAAAVLLCALYVSCTDPVFYQLEAEVKPKEPKINGSPSKIVPDGAGNLYVANGDIWRWDGSTWNNEGSPEKAIRDVAWAGGALFALAVDNITTKLYRRDTAGGWAPVGNASGYSFLQAIYGVEDQLYVSARNGSDFHVLVYQNSQLEATAFHEHISGAAADDDYRYFAAKSSIFKFALDDINLAGSSIVTGSTDKGEWVGIAAGTVGTVETVAAVSRTGHVCIVAGGEEKGITKPENSYNYTGAVTFWKNGDLNYLLIGLRGSSYTNGYRELAINTEAGIEAGGYGSPSISVESPEKYNSTLGVHALTSIMQAPGTSGTEHPLLFASTQQNGLWSYRGVWNAEE